MCLRAEVWNRAVVFALVLAGGTSAPVLAGPKESPDSPIGIPFELDRNRIVLPVRVQDSGVLRVILDTGMPIDGLFLFHREAREALPGVTWMDCIVPGAGSGEGSRSVMAESVAISCGDLELADKRVVISQSETTQSFPTDGAIGYSLFGHFVVDIDYDARLLRLHPPAAFEPPNGYRRLDVELQNNIPFLNASASIAGENAVDLRVYIDLASGDAVEMLVRPDAKFAVPDSLEDAYLGTGLSGDVRGGRGRVARFTLGGFVLRDVAAVFPQSEVRSKQKSADAVLGNDLIRRFNVIFDHAGSCLYLKPNETFSTAFD